MQPSPLITLTTDFGQRDGYASILKGVILGICVNAQVVDITHHIPAHDISAAAFVMQTVVPYFPRGTIHIVIVDPGVGTNRHAVVLATPNAHFVAPDNGILYPLWQSACATWHPDELQLVQLTEPRYWLPTISTTFHGRDIFAPVAAHLACGVPLGSLGQPLETLTPLPLSRPRRAHPDRLIGQIIYIDHFGNCVTNITREDLEELGSPALMFVYAGDDSPPLPILNTYADAPAESLLALIGSAGQLEVAQRNGNAQKKLDISVGDPVIVQLVFPR